MVSNSNSDKTLTLRERRMANLTPWEKGVCPNKNGRPKGAIGLTATLKKMLEIDVTLKNPFTNEKETKLAREWITGALIAKATKGDIPAAREVFDRVEGKAIQKVNTITTLDLSNINLSSLTDEQIERLIADNTTTVEAQLEDDD